EFGIKIAGTGNKWYKADSPLLEGNLILAGSDAPEALQWIGDSCMLEAAGLGAFAAAASPAVLRAQGGSFTDGLKRSLEMEEITLANHSAYLIPAFDYRGTPLGIDIRKVLKTGIVPVIHGGIIARDGKRLGAGLARVPEVCFAGAAEGFYDKYGENDTP
ncbi:MAG: DUF1116 domain-containing protein, partial [Eubacteriales bacterium]|nr:DUF1116 domain-containing protein [Eubacteriales bacterium]